MTERIRELALAALIATLFVCVSPESARAQPYEVTWSTVDSGGVMNASSVTYEAGGTIGQHYAQTLSGTTYTVTGGFWQPIAPMSCPSSSAPLPDYDPVPDDIGFGTKNRYLTFSGGDAGQQQAARVKFVSLPYYDGPEPPANYDFRFAEGRTMFVQEPVPVTEAGGSDGPVPPPTFWAATLGCEPYYTGWTQYDKVDVYDAGIIPDGLYNVQFIDIDCALADEGAYSDALPVQMSEAGDVVGNSPGPAPQGVVDFVDIAAVVDKFKNSPGSIRKARADITNGNLALPNPDRKIDFVDISCLVSAFRAEPCSIVGPPVVDPCPER